MAQQVFPQWSPVVKAHNEDQQEVYIPAAIIHAQTRDGKDELIVGAANMQFDPETGDYLPTHAGNPVEVRARALETLLQTLGKEETLALVKAALDVLVSKDFATQTTLAAVLEKLDDLATESTLDGVKSAVDALVGTVDAGAQKVTLTGRLPQPESAIPVQTTGQVSRSELGGSITVEPGQIVDIFEEYLNDDHMAFDFTLLTSRTGVNKDILDIRYRAGITGYQTDNGLFVSGLSLGDKDLLAYGLSIGAARDISTKTPIRIRGRRWSLQAVNRSGESITIRQGELRRYKTYHGGVIL